MARLFSSNMKQRLTFRLREGLASPALFLLKASEEVLVGGQAVFEGVMMRAPKTYSVAVRRSDGSMAVKREFLKGLADKNKLWRYPVLRGMSTLGQALVLGIRALKFSTDEAMADAHKEKKTSKKEATGDKSELKSWAVGLNVLFAVTFFILLFKLLPLVLTNGIKAYWPSLNNPLFFSLVDGTLRLAIFLLYVYLISLLKDIRRIFEYHGAEHKVVFNYESREELSIQNARKYSTLHPRCGTSFLIVVMLVSMIVYAVIPFSSLWLKLLSRVVLIPAIAGVSYEIIRHAARNENWVLRWITTPGLWLQQLTTREPSDDQLEIAIRALTEALTLEKTEGRLAVV
jgi:uncharacterized protein YqhQ